MYYRKTEFEFEVLPFWIHLVITLDMQEDLFVEENVQVQCPCERFLGMVRVGILPFSLLNQRQPALM